jgi:hypothetical protein
MLDNLLNLIKENAGDAIINNPAIPNEHNDAACETAANAIFKGLQGQIAKGGLKSVTDLFNQGGNVASHPAIKNIEQNLSGDMMAKFGLDKAAVGNIVSSLLPVVMSKLVSKTNDPGDSSFNLDGILGSLGGKQGKSGGLLGSLGKLLGGR